MTPTTERLRQEARNQRRRGIVFVVAVGVSYWHFVAHDAWWRTPEGAVAHTLVSVALVAAGMWASRLWGALLLMAQPLTLFGAIGTVYAAGEWSEGWVTAVDPWRIDPCVVESDTRLYVCPSPHRLRTYARPRYDRNIQEYVGALATRAAVLVVGPAPGSYLGPIPEEAEAFALAKGAEAVEMTEAGVDAAFGGSRPWDWKWRGVRSLGAVHLGGGILFVWDGGTRLELYDVKTRRLVQTWERPDTSAPLRLPRFDGTLVDNALWLRRRWLHASNSDADMAALNERALAHDITTLYPFVGPMKPGGRFGWRDGESLAEYDPEIARSFFTRAHAPPPTVPAPPTGLPEDGVADLIVVERLPPPTILPWTGGVLGRDAFPESPDWRAEFVAQAKALVDLGADGIHVNIEPMPEETPGYLDLLRELKAALGPERLVSVAAYPPPTPLHPYADVHWSLAFLAQVCSLADDVSVMTYDTALSTPEAYAKLMSEWTTQLSTLRNCHWRVGIPTYEEYKPWHRPEAETLSAALDGVISAVGRDGPAGLAIYASWTTDRQEWAEFDIRRGASPTNVEPIDTP